MTGSSTPTPAPTPTPSARRGQATAGLLAVVGLALAGLAAQARWVTAAPASPDLPGSARVELSGGALVPALVPLALVAAAGLVAAVAAGRMARGVLRLVASVVVVLAGLAVAWVALRGTTDPAAAVRSVEAARTASASLAVDRSPVGWVSVLGGLVLTGAGLVALATGRRWPGLGARYDRDPAASDAGRRPPATTWDALERGDDPTR